jgi:hypothetical protein
MVIYIEGVDGSGKSTFAKAITEFLKKEQFTVHPNAEKAMVTHPWRLDRTNKNDLLFNLRARLLSPDIFIVDRGELSDIIYRTFDYEKYSALMTLAEYYEHWRRFSDQYIIVHCDTHRSEELMLARGEDNQVSIVEHQRLRFLFNQVMPLFNAIKYDAAIGISNPDYLLAVCNNIAFTVHLKGAVKHE